MNKCIDLTLYTWLSFLWEHCLYYTGAEVVLNNKTRFITAYYPLGLMLIKVAECNFSPNGIQYLCSLRCDIHSEHNWTATEAFANSFSEHMQADTSNGGQNWAHFTVIIRRCQGIIPLSMLLMHTGAETWRQGRTKYLTFIKVPRIFHVFCLLRWHLCHFGWVRIKLCHIWFYGIIFSQKYFRCQIAVSEQFVMFFKLFFHSNKLAVGDNDYFFLWVS